VDWLEITVTIPPEGVEPVAEIFQETGAGGVVIEDPAVILRYAAQTHPEEWAVPPGAVKDGLPLVKGYLPVDSELPEQLEDFKSALNCLALFPSPKISTRIIPEEDWAGAWKAHYKPEHIGRRLVVKPSWESYNASENELIIEIDPGMAFGSGTHATTAMCLRLLEEYMRPGLTVYDVGTGTGILAIAAAKLGADRVVAVDIDSLACKVAAGNVERNGVGGQVRVVHGNLLDLLDSAAGLIVSNILADVIISLAPGAARMLAPGGILIASGIIRERAGEVRAALEVAGLSICEQMEDGQWVALVAKKSTGAS